MSASISAPMNVGVLSDIRDAMGHVPLAKEQQLVEDAHTPFWDLAATLICSRQHVSPKRLDSPGPSAQQLDALMRLAAAAPDHGMLTPWRFVLISTDQRRRLAEVFALALVDRDPSATLEQIETARDKAYRAPVLLMAIARTGPDDAPIPAVERLISAGCAIQNLLLGAHAMGFGTGLTSGQALQSHRLHELLRLAPGEVPVCCINLGTVSKHKPSSRIRPEPAAILTSL